MKKLNIIFFTLIVLSVSVFSQSDNSIDILTLDECIALAIENAPELKVSNAIINQAAALNTKANTSWMLENTSAIAQSAYVYRRHLEFGGAEADPDVDPVTNNTTYFGPQTDNRVGVVITLPLSTWRWKKADKAFAAASLDEKTELHNSQMLVIQNQVLMLYKQFEQASNKLSTSSDNYESQKSAFTVAEEQFSNGSIDVEKYSNVKQSSITAEDAFNDAKTMLEIAYHTLKLRVGAEIIKE